jgi:O-antigen/teichoic acid export membrane protein
MGGVSQFAVAAAGAATTVLLARTSGPQGIRAYAVAQTLILLLMVFSTLGLGLGIVYHVSAGRWAPQRALAASRAVAVLTGSVAMSSAVLVRILAPGLMPGLSIADTIAAASAVPFAVSWYLASYVALSIGEFGLYALPVALQAGMVLCLVPTLGALCGTTGVVAGITCAHALAGVVTGASVHRRVHRLSAVSRGAEPGVLRAAICYGLKGNASNVLQFMNNRLDLLILNTAVAAAAVGQYAVAVAVTTVLWLAPQALGDVLLSRVSAQAVRDDAGNGETLLKIESRAMRHLVVITAALAAAAACFLIGLVPLIYGSAFRRSATLGLILLPGAALFGVSGLFVVAIEGRGRVGLSVARAVIVTPATILLYLTMIPRLGATGAALASTLSYAASFVVASLQYRSVTGANPLLTMLPSRTEFQDYVWLARGARRRMFSSRASRAIV